jgi:hypothetical protein
MPRKKVEKPIPKETPRPAQTAEAISSLCEEIKEMLLRKNAAYGDSALKPMRVFSRVDNVEQLKVRIDDKLSRLSRGHELPDEKFEDTVDDLIGYLVLFKIAAKRANNEKLGVRL